MLKRTLLFTLFAVVMSFIIASPAPARDEEARRCLRQGIRHTNQENLDEAIAELNKSLASNPEDASTYLALGIAYVNKRMEREAVPFLEKSIELEPERATAYFLLARIYESHDENQKAIRMWEEFLTLNPGARHREIAEKHLRRLRGL